MHKNLYEIYHTNRDLQTKIISENNFTYRNILQILNNIHYGENVLDIGCGVGTLDYYIAQKDKNVCGVDISKSAIDICKKNAKLLGLQKKMKFFCADFLKFDNKSKFGLIICSEVLEHLNDDRLAVKKIYKMLNLNGLAIFSVPSVNAPLYKIGLLDKFDKQVGHLRRYDTKRIKKLMISANFKIVRIYLTEGMFRNFLFTFKLGSFLNRLANRFSPICEILSFVDKLTLYLFGESNVYVLVSKS